MVVTYGALGPQGQAGREPTFTRQLALLRAAASRRGPSRRGSGSRGILDYLNNRVAKDKYARALLDEQLRTAVAKREMTQAVPGAERERIDLSRGRLGLEERGVGLRERELEQQIRDAIERRDLERERLGFEQQRLGAADQRQSFLDKMATARFGLDERELSERIRHNKESERIRGNPQPSQGDIRNRMSMLQMLYQRAVDQGNMELARRIDQKMSQLGISTLGEGEQAPMQDLVSELRRGDVQASIPKVAENVDADTFVATMQSRAAKKSPEHLARMLRGHLTTNGIEPTRDNVLALFKAVIEREDVREALGDTVHLDRMGGMMAVPTSIPAWARGMIQKPLLAGYHLNRMRGQAPPVDREVNALLSEMLVRLGRR